MTQINFKVTLLESREKCEIKLTKPLKFLTGRKDCISNDPKGRPYVIRKREVRKIATSKKTLVYM